MQYLYNNTHLCEYLGTYSGDRILSDCATTVKPPEFEPETLPCFNPATRTWDTVVEDYRGKTAWLKDNSLVRMPVVLAGPLQTGYTITPPPDDANKYRMQDGEWTKVVPPPVPPVDKTEFTAACVKFRMICYKIGELIDNPNFKGGFDEMAEFQQSQAFSTMAGLQAALEWSAANELCKYEGAKIGLGQPAWWYDCWKTQD